MVYKKRKCFSLPGRTSSQTKKGKLNIVHVPVYMHDVLFQCGQGLKHRNLILKYLYQRFIFVLQHSLCLLKLKYWKSATC